MYLPEVEVLSPAQAVLLSGYACSASKADSSVVSWTEECSGSEMPENRSALVLSSHWCISDLVGSEPTRARAT